MAVEKVRQKLLKMMMPANKRKQASRSHTPSVNTVSSVERLAQQPRPDDGKIGELIVVPFTVEIFKYCDLTL